jgi:hypothetical protein
VLEGSDGGFRANQAGVGDEKIRAAVDPPRLGLHENAMALGGLDVNNHVGHGIDVIGHGVMSENDAAVFGHPARGDKGGAGLPGLLHDVDVAGQFFLCQRPPIGFEFDLGVVGDDLTVSRRNAGRVQAVRDAPQLGAVLRVDRRLDEPLGVSDEPGPLHAAVVLPMGPSDPQAFGDFIGQQVAVLKTPLGRAALDMEINPTRALMTLRSAEPFLLLLGEGRPIKTGLGEPKTSETKCKGAEIHGWRMGAMSCGSTS